MPSTPKPINLKTTTLNQENIESVQQEHRGPEQPENEGSEQQQNNPSEQQENNGSEQQQNNPSEQQENNGSKQQGGRRTEYKGMVFNFMLTTSHSLRQVCRALARLKIIIVVVVSPSASVNFSH